MSKMADENLVVREILDSQMLLRKDDPGISRDLLERGIREAAVVEVLEHEIHSGDTVIDIGSNIGYYVLLEARLVGPQGTVYAIEPVPENYELLCKNIELNGLTNVKPYLLAIGSHTGKEKLHLTHQSNCGVIMGSVPRSFNFEQRMNQIGTGTEIEVNIMTLDDFIRQEGIDPDLIRMDVEGYEIAVIEGMKETLSTAENLKIEMELHYGHYDDPGTITRALREVFSSGFYQKYFVSRLGTELLPDAHVLLNPHYRSAPHVLLEKRPMHILADLPQVGYRGGAARALCVLINELAGRSDIKAKIKVNREVPSWKDLSNVEICAPRSHAALANIYGWADVIITQSRQLGVVKDWSGNKPIVYYMHNDYRVGRSSNVYNEDLNEENVDLLLFNAQWVKDRTQWEGKHLVVYPPVFPDRFKTKTTREYISQVNLNRPKGGDVFYAMAKRLSDKKFLGVEGWGPQVRSREKLKNVTVIPSTPKIKEDVYAKTRILLAPSQYAGDTDEFIWTESWGMAAVEAMSSGIPVIASPAPGLKESLGDAGIFVDRDDLDGWEEAIRKLDDPEVYAHHSKLARDRAFELDPTPQIEKLAECLRLLGMKYLQGSINRTIPEGMTAYRKQLLVKNIGDRTRERGGYVFYPGITVVVNARRVALSEIKACSDLQLIDKMGMGGSVHGPYEKKDSAGNCGERLEL